MRPCHNRNCSENTTLFNGKSVYCADLEMSHCMIVGIKTTLTHRWRTVGSQRFSTVWSSPLMLMLGWPSPFTVKHSRSSPTGWQCEKLSFILLFHRAESDGAVDITNTKDEK